MKRITFIIILGSIVSCSYGQLYIQPSVGYTFSSHPMESQSIMVIDNLETVYKIKLKYGEGMHLGLSIGYNLMNNFLIELNTKHTIYSNCDVSTVRPDLQSLNSFYLSGFFGDINIKSSIFQIAPLIGFQVHKNKFSTCFKFGPNFMKSTINLTYNNISWDMDENLKFNPVNTLAKEEYTGKFHIGLQANLGFSYSIRNNLSLALDFVTVCNNYEITKAETKQYEIDGVNHLDELENTNIEIDKDNNKINHSHYGINVGIKYIFNKNK